MACSNISDICVRTESVTEKSSELSLLLNDSAVRIFQSLCFGVICQAVNIFGTVTNIINIICFYNQGFKESVNISLFGLAISDLGCLVTMMWSNICLIPAFQDAELSFDPLDIQSLTTGFPHIVFTRVTSSITAFVTLERCLCITMPLKVKSIFTPRRVTVMISLIFATLVASIVPIYFVSGFGMKYLPRKNKTVLGLVHTEDRVFVESIVYSINSVLIPFSSLFIITVCMTIIVVSLKKQAKWRTKLPSSSKAKANNASYRDQKIAKMVLMISVLFVACFTPSLAVFLGIVLVPDLTLGGKYQNIAVVVYGMGIVFESVNSAMNIFIYYYRSSRYRTAFRHLFFSRRLLSKSDKVV